jgi:hypothetical protein
MNSLRFIILCSIWILLLGINFETIRSFPSWFDEAFMANMAFNLSEGRGMILDLIPGYWNGELLLYGPLYFYLQSGLIKLFGLQDIIFRFPAYFSAYLSVVTLFLILRRNKLGYVFMTYFLIAVVVDVSFNRSLVSGRMDMLAVLLVLLALYFSGFECRKSACQRIQWTVVGFLSASAYLTTPRSLFLLPCVAVYSLSKLLGWPVHLKQLNANKVVLLLFAFLAFIVPVGIWIWYVGGPSAYIGLFRQEGASKHIAPSFFRSPYDNIAIVIMLVLVVLNYKKLMTDALAFGLFLTYIAFSLCVKEVGPYAGMIMPFVLALIVILLEKSDLHAYSRYALIAAITLPGLLLAGLRGVDLRLNSACRDGAAVAAKAEMFIGREKKIVAPFKYYFLLEKPGRELVTFDYSKLEKNIVVADAGLVISGTSTIQHEWLSSCGFNRVGSFVCLARHVPFLPATFYGRSTYFGDIYFRASNGSEK